MDILVSFREKKNVRNCIKIYMNLRKDENKMQDVDIQGNFFRFCELFQLNNLKGRHFGYLDLSLKQFTVVGLSAK